MIDWTKLEERIGLEALPNFHRAFLQSRGVNTEGMMLRRIQQSVERELNRLVLEGKAQRLEDRVLVATDAIPDLELPGGGSVRALLDELIHESA